MRGPESMASKVDDGWFREASLSQSSSHFQGERRAWDLGGGSYCPQTAASSWPQSARLRNRRAGSWRDNLGTWLQGQGPGAEGDTRRFSLLCAPLEVAVGKGDQAGVTLVFSEDALSYRGLMPIWWFPSPFPFLPSHALSWDVSLLNSGVVRSCTCLLAWTVGSACCHEWPI